MPEMTHRREYHRHTVLVGGGDDFGVTHAATRLDHGGDADGGRVVDAVAEREERVGCHDCTLHLQPGVLRFDGGDAGRIDATHLTGAHPDCHEVFAVNNGVRFYELRHAPGEEEITHLLLGGRALRHHLQV